MTDTPNSLNDWNDRMQAEADRPQPNPHSPTNMPGGALHIRHRRNRPPTTPTGQPFDPREMGFEDMPAGAATINRAPGVERAAYLLSKAAALIQQADTELYCATDEKTIEPLAELAEKLSDELARRIEP